MICPQAPACRRPPPSRPPQNTTILQMLPARSASERRITGTMENTMQLDPSHYRTNNRKRSIHQRDLSSDDDSDLAFATPRLDDSSPKRLRNRRGEAVQRRDPPKYNAQRLLNSLAFTQVYVTANFHKYNPSASPVLICVFESDVRMYRALW